MLCGDQRIQSVLDQPGEFLLHFGMVT
jgi:hypothetical protein